MSEETGDEVRRRSKEMLTFSGSETIICISTGIAIKSDAISWRALDKAFTEKANESYSHKKCSITNNSEVDMALFASSFSHSDLPWINNPTSSNAPHCSTLNN